MKTTTKSFRQMQEEKFCYSEFDESVDITLLEVDSKLKEFGLEILKGDSGTPAVMWKIIRRTEG